MSRGLTATNRAEVDADSLREVALVKLEFSSPIYAHSGFGSITYDGDVYQGVGDLGNISNARESEILSPSPLDITLSGLNADLQTAALAAGSYGDVATIFVGYRAEDNTLVDDPWTLWKGWYEFGTLSLGESNQIRMTIQHDLSILKESDGSRYSDEDHQQNYSGDLAFEFVHEMRTLDLLWGNTNTLTRGDDGRDTPGDRFLF